MRRRSLLRCSGTVFVAFALLFLGGTERTSAQGAAQKQESTPQNIVRPPGPIGRPPGPTPIRCCTPTPYATPDVLELTALPNSSLNLKAPVRIDPGEMKQGGWATNIIQTNINLTPDQGELARLADPLDLLIGEALVDATYPYPAGPTRVKNPSVVFQVPISFTSTGLQWTGPNYSCNTGGTCTPAYQSDGTHGIYYARVEDCLSTSDHPSLPPVLDGGGNPLACTSADGITGNNGFWYDIAPVWGATATLGFGSGRVPPDGVAQTVVDTLKVPAQLPVRSNSIRIEFVLGLKNYYALDGDFIDHLYWGDEYQSGPLGGPEHAVTRFAVQLQPITVLPAALMQMKVLPYTIVYRPPGDQSTGTYVTTQSFGTSMSVGSSTTLDNTKTFEQSFGVNDDFKVTALIAAIQLADGQSQTTSGSWDNNAVIGKGLTVSNSTTQAISLMVGSSTSDASVIPAHEYVVPNTCNQSNYSSSTCSVMPGENYAQEPFWADLIILLLHPQAALWDFNGTPGVQLLGAADFDSVSIRDLATCSRNSDPNAWRLSDGDFLSPSECQDLLSLDPFYGAGQGIDPSVSGRGLHLGNGPYGRDPLQPSSSSSSTFNAVFSYATAQSTNGTTSFNSTVTDVIGFSWSEGVTLSYQYSQYGLNVGFSAGTTITQGEKLTTSTSMKVTYSSSTIATTTNATQIIGAFNDDHDFYTPDCQQNSGKCYRPSVTVYLDELFGSYMFQDRDAPCNPLKSYCTPLVLGNFTLSDSSAIQRIPLPAAESSVVSSLRNIYRTNFAYAEGRPRQGYASTLREIDSTLDSGEKTGYRFSYVPQSKLAGGRTDAYQIAADPVGPGKPGGRHFFMDETGVIRISQTGAADVKSPTLR
jgi:hypothetical protein